MSVPSTRTQILIVWTIVCASLAIGLKLAAEVAASPAECFECGFGRYVLESALTLVVIVWGAVAVLLLARRDSS